MQVKALYQVINETAEQLDMDMSEFELYPVRRK